MRSGCGVLKKIGGGPSTAVVAIERGPRDIGAFFVTPEVAQALMDEFGVPEGELINMRALIGRRVEYLEDEYGFITRLDVHDEGPVEQPRAGANQR